MFGTPRGLHNCILNMSPEIKENSTCSICDTDVEYKPFRVGIYNTYDKTTSLFEGVYCSECVSVDVGNDYMTVTGNDPSLSCVVVAPGDHITTPQ